MTEADAASDPPSLTTTTHPGWLAEQVPAPTVPVWIWNRREPEPVGSAFSSLAV